MSIATVVPCGWFPTPPDCLTIQADRPLAPPAGWGWPVARQPKANLIPLFQVPRLLSTDMPASMEVERELIFFVLLAMNCFEFDFSIPSRSGCV